MARRTLSIDEKGVKSKTVVQRKRLDKFTVI